MFRGMTSNDLLDEGPATPSNPAIDAPAPAQVAPAPARMLGTGNARQEEHILPSGRVVRLRRITTGEYLGAKERATVRVGKHPDPKGTRQGEALNREVLCLMVVAYTSPDIDWETLMEQQAAQQEAAHLLKYPVAADGMPASDAPAFSYVPDRAALVAQVPASAYTMTTPQLLMIAGPQCIDNVFTEVADWEVLGMCAGQMLLPSRDLSRIVGKARVVG